jgi:hypothetical protein
MDTAAEFTELFVGNTDAAGGDNGLCVRRPASTPAGQWIRDLVIHHLHGTTPIGFYPHYNHTAIDGTLTTYTAWGCVDFDEGDEPSWVHAQNLKTVLNELGIVAWVERSRSKGFHVWVFPTEHCDAPTMRYALAVAVSIADAPNREINPKQTRLQPKPDGTTPVGNYVRAPYPHEWQHTNRRCMVDDLGEPIPLETFLHKCSANLTPVKMLEHAASLWTPPEPVEAPPAVTAPHMGDDTLLPGLVAHLIINGPMSDNHDRSAWLWRLCRTMAEKHVPWVDARQALTEADRRWGKFHERPEGETDLDRMLAKAYGAK